MPRSRFVLRYRGDGPKPDDDVVRVERLEGVEVIDSSSRMLLVESEPGPLRRLMEELPDWVIDLERTYEVPDTRKKVLRPPD